MGGERGDRADTARLCHCALRSGVDGGDLYFQLWLAVALFFVIALAAFVFEDVDFGALHGADDVSGDGGAGDGGEADLGLAFAADEEDAVEGDGLFVADDFAIDVKDIAAGDFVLVAGRFDNRVHEINSVF